MYFIYQKDNVTGRVTASVQHDIPHDLNGKPTPVIMLVSLLYEEESLSISELEKKYPRP